MHLKESIGPNISSNGVFTPEQDNDKTKVEPVHSYDAFHKGIIEMHKFNICLVVVLLWCNTISFCSCGATVTTPLYTQGHFNPLRVPVRRTGSTIQHRFLFRVRGDCYIYSGTSETISLKDVAEKFNLLYAGGGPFYGPTVFLSCARKFAAQDKS